MPVRNLLFFALLFAFLPGAPAAAQDIDQHAVNAPPEVEKSVASLTQYLIKPAKTDQDKVRAIFRWITDRVSYDVDSFLKNQPPDGRPGSVLESRSAVCDGYARLFQEMCKEAGVESVIVNGYARGVTYKPGEAIKGNHSWNAVKLDGEWRLIDSTWGAGHMNGPMFIKKFNNFFFLPPPDLMIFSHLPKDEKWQLLTPAVSAEEFQKLPYAHNTLFRLGVDGQQMRASLDKEQPREFVKVYTPKNEAVKLLNLPLSKHLTAGTKYQFRIDAPGTPRVLLVNNTQNSFLTKSGDQFTGSVTPARGMLRLALTDPLEPNRFWYLLEYEVE